MSYFTPPDDKSKKYYIFGEGGGKKMSEEQNVPLLGEIPIITAIRESCDRGLPTVLDGKLGPEAEIFKAITRKIISLLRLSHFKKDNPQQ
jgi:ATP-binding protein involved in chromosome partitioning